MVDSKVIVPESLPDSKVSLIYEAIQQNCYPVLYPCQLAAVRSDESSTSLGWQVWLATRYTVAQGL